MKVSPLSTLEPWYDYVMDTSKADHKTTVQVLQDVPVEVSVFVEQAHFIHAGENERFRPALHLYGRVTKTTTSGVDLPFGVTELEYEDNNGPVAHIYYDFSTTQLSHLVVKGYFEKGFEVPKKLTGIPYELSTRARMVFISPEGETDPPIVFLTIQDLNNLYMNEETSGYILAGYFPDILTQRKTQNLEKTSVTELSEMLGKNKTVDENSIGAVSWDSGEDLFAESPREVKQNPEIDILTTDYSTHVKVFSRGQKNVAETVKSDATLTPMDKLDKSYYNLYYEKVSDGLETARAKHTARTGEQVDLFDEQALEHELGVEHEEDEETLTGRSYEEFTDEEIFVDEPAWPDSINTRGQLELWEMVSESDPELGATLAEIFKETYTQNEDSSVNTVEPVVSEETTRSYVEEESKDAGFEMD